MSTVRVEKTEKYSVIANQPINDKSLSWGARGLLAYLLSKPNDWQVRMTDLENQSPAGSHATRTLVRELEKAGYMVRKRYQTKGGKFAWMVTVYEVSQNQKITQEKTIPQLSIDGLSIDGKVPDIVSTDLLNTESLMPQAAQERIPPPKNGHKPDMIDMMIKYSKPKTNLLDLSTLPPQYQDYAYAFVKAAGEEHAPKSFEKSKWMKILGQWDALGLSDKQIMRAVEKMRKDGLTIGGPESVTKTARDMSATPQKVDRYRDVY